MKKGTLRTAAACLLFALGCNQDTQDQIQNEVDQLDAQYYYDLADEMLAEDADELEFRGATVTVPAGSVDAIQDAVDQAGYNGTVILEAGEHIQNGSVTITHKVKIKGQNGAIVKFNTDLDTDDQNPLVLSPGFYIKDANQVVIENLHLKSLNGLAMTAIATHNTNQVRIRNNLIEEFGLGVVQEHGNNTRIHDNTIINIVAWSFYNVNGDNLKLYDNTLGRVFLGDKGGLVKDNHFFAAEFMALLLCTPPDLLEFPDGTTGGPAEEPSNNYLVIDNIAENSGNMLWGFLVVDGANKNTLVNNQSEDAALYDTEMAGPTDRFGFNAPTSFDNLTISTQYPDEVIKVCGENNQAVGGTQVNTETDPCW